MKKVEGDDRFLRAPFDETKNHKNHERKRQDGQKLPVERLAVVGAVRERVEHQQQTQEKSRGAQEIQLGRMPVDSLFLEADYDQPDRDGCYRKIDEKDPAPTGVLDDESAGQRTKDRRDLPNPAYDALDLG